MKTFLRKLSLLIFGTDFVIRNTAELKEMGCYFAYDTLNETDYKSIWFDKKCRRYKCIHSSKSQMDQFGRDIINKFTARDPNIMRIIARKNNLK